VTGKADATGIRPNGDPLLFQNGTDRIGDVRILAADQARPHLHDRHVRAEATIHLRKFQPDV
jgi:hypothetical protein